MTEFLLIRHAINDWVKTGRLAGWTPGVHLNADGQAQAQSLGQKLADTKLAAIYSSPLERTMETAQAIAAQHPTLDVQSFDAVGEVRYGAWQGEKLTKLRRDKMWQTVQVYPSRAQFPGGEAIRQAQARAVDGLETLAQRHPDGRVVVVSHSDIIKLIVNHYLGAHIDLFQRLDISPASITVMFLGDNRPYIVRVNDTSFLPPFKRTPLAQSPSRKVWQRVRRLTRRNS